MLKINLHILVMSNTLRSDSMILLRGVVLWYPTVEGGEECRDGRLVWDMLIWLLEVAFDESLERWQRTLC